MSEGRQELDRMLSEIHARLGGDELPELCLFAGRKGRSFDHGLLAVGRAVNGWGASWRLEEAATAAGRATIIDPELRDRNEDENPMGWVLATQRRPEDFDGYSTSRSAFWRVIRRVALGLGQGSDQSWPSHIAWTNLYKVAPAKGGNPSDRLCSVQLDGCAAYLMAEIEELRPRWILALTGWSWFRGLADPIGAQLARVDGGPIEATGQLAGATLVVGPHPQGKAEDPIVEAALAAFRGDTTTVDALSIVEGGLQQDEDGDRWEPPAEAVGAYQLIKTGALVHVHVVDTEVTEVPGGGETVVRMELRLGEEDEDGEPTCDHEWGAFGFLFCIGLLSFADARPRGVSGMHFSEQDEFLVGDLLAHLRYENGELRLVTDYVRGRSMKTDVVVRADGTASLRARGRGEAPLRWIQRLQGDQPVRAVVPTREPP